MKRNKGPDIKRAIKEHISNNKKEYIVVTFIFVIGIFIGVFFVNNIQDSQKTEIYTYLNSFIGKLKDTENIDNFELLKISIKENLILALLIWFLGTTVIRNTNCIWYYIL